ncbi:MAG: glycosyltransferase family 4 protein [Candidatus Pedobacter colombiensis]|uniref:Glycosyltransferase family 4 protein n=1 Tax=Candidatus Pedobacter colombiensis TaxID=3121371 RepID=A0AAJ5W7T5_9SPHI|nr:glycosyltransferase family 4 protein [Pedobacter sp.]WEK19175.1 MAG: glycosyltransferase family 4 protein [Pedobacter sp.]
MKKILFFMPDNPVKKNAGNKIRALSFLNYFKSRGFQVHFVSEYYWGEWNNQDITDFEQSGLADKTFILPRKASKKNLLYYFFCYKLPNFFYQKKYGIFAINFPELVTYRLQKAFNKILKNNQYDYVFINYASWASLIENNKHIANAQTVLDTHDFLTAQNQYKFDIGASFKEEIRRLSLFSKVLAISIEEQYLFSQFCWNEICLAPMMIGAPAPNPTPVADRKFDLIYIASRNPHNIEAANWFISKVYPLLPQSLNICIIGQITTYIKGNHPNITLIPFAEDLRTYYHQSKIAICPMLSGTGTKIKVIEALSYHLPIVCNTRGIDGLINKTNNGCLVSDQPEEFSRHIINLLQQTNTYEKQSLFAKEAFESGYEQEFCYHKLDKLF